MNEWSRKPTDLWSFERGLEKPDQEYSFRRRAAFILQICRETSHDERTCIFPWRIFALQFIHGNSFCLENSSANFVQADVRFSIRLSEEFIIILRQLSNICQSWLPWKWIKSIIRSYNRIIKRNVCIDYNLICPALEQFIVRHVRRAHRLF